jgi:hypothetical protein
MHLPQKPLNAHTRRKLFHSTFHLLLTPDLLGKAQQRDAEHTHRLARQQEWGHCQGAAGKQDNPWESQGLG